MAHYAKVKNAKVLQVIVAEQSYVDSLPSESGVTWIQTSYNTMGGVHYSSDDPPVPDGGVALRKNFAGIGDTYDSTRDAFIPQKPFNSWVLNETTCLWDAPVDKPNDGKTYNWDEDNEQWVVVDFSG